MRYPITFPSFPFSVQYSESLMHRNAMLVKCSTYLQLFPKALSPMSLSLFSQFFQSNRFFQQLIQVATLNQMLIRENMNQNKNDSRDFSFLEYSQSWRPLAFSEQETVLLWGMFSVYSSFTIRSIFECSNYLPMMHS